MGESKRTSMNRQNSHHGRQDISSMAGCYGSSTVAFILVDWVTGSREGGGFQNCGRVRRQKRYQRPQLQPHMIFTK